MGQPAARLGDPTSHAGTPLGPGPGSINVLVGGQPAWRAGSDLHVCPLSDGPKPHVGGTVAVGSTTVLINALPAARQGDLVVEVGPPNAIMMGAPTVLIGAEGMSFGDGKEFLGSGWAFPPAIEPGSGQIVSSAYEEDVRQSIRIILETSKGERVMRPDFGCGIHDLVFGAISTALLRGVEHEVEDALRRFEARIDLLEVRVNSAAAERGQLDVSIDYRIRSTNQPGNFVYPFYFKEGA